MKLVYTEQSLKSLEESLEFIAPQVSIETLETIRNSILDWKRGKSIQFKAI